MGVEVGIHVGRDVVGTAEGEKVGCLVEGWIVGTRDGLKVGANVGVGLG